MVKFIKTQLRLLLYFTLILMFCEKKEFENPLDPKYQQSLINIEETKSIKITDMSSSQTIEMQNGTIIDIPTNSLKTDSEIKVKTGQDLNIRPSTKTGQQISDMINIEIKNGTIIKPLNLLIPLNKEIVNDFNEKKICISFYSENKWIPIKSFITDEQTHVECSISEEGWYILINLAVIPPELKGFTVYPTLFDNINQNNLEVSTNPEFNISIPDTSLLETVYINFRIFLESQPISDDKETFDSILNSSGNISENLQYDDIIMTKKKNKYIYTLNIISLNNNPILSKIEKIKSFIKVRYKDWEIHSEPIELRFFEITKPKIELIFPVNSKRTGTTPLFKWLITDYENSYNSLKLYIDKDNPFRENLEPVADIEDIQGGEYRLSFTNSLEIGNYYWGLKLCKGLDEIHSTTRSFEVAENHPPSAKINVDKTSGYIGTIFTFDASGSSDALDSLNYLKFRWDWESDGIWDTDYSSEPIVTHSFINVGYSKVVLEAIDTELLSNKDTTKIFIQDNPPDVEIKTPDAIQSDKIKIEFEISDSDQNTNDFVLYFNNDNKGYTLLTIDSLKIGNVDLVLGRPSKISNVLPGKNFIIWNSTVDIPNKNSDNVKIKLRWIDKYDTGGLSEGIETGTFSVHNVTDLPPSANFSISPEEGVTGTLFTLDVSTSTDSEDEFSQLRFRWDWEGDGIWDTNYQSAVTYYHKYEISGEYNITLEVKDSAENTDTKSRTLIINSNSAPIVNITSPGNNAQYNFGANINFSVEVSDPDGETLLGNSLIWSSNLDGNFGTGYSFNYSGLNAGNHVITIEASDSWGIKGTDTVNITINLAEEDEMVLIPSGSFTMGDGSEDAPLHTVYLDAYYIDKYEVTNEQFASFLNDGNDKYYNSYMKIQKTDSGYVAATGFEDHPIIFVTWTGANAYASWCGKRLPTEAEWEKAARGYNKISYPWGWILDGSYANYKDSGDPYESNQFPTTPVGFYNGTNRDGFQTSKATSPFGIYDMAGNVWEWAADWYGIDYYLTTAAQTNPQGPSGGSKKVIRGGSWANYVFQITTGYRYSMNPSLTNSAVGFRCAKDPE